jgi:hypothetical protein
LSLACRHRRSLKEIYEGRVESQLPVVLVAWDDLIDPCPAGVVQTYSKAVLDWVARLEARGQTEMRKAIEWAMITYPNARNVIVMTDGAILPRDGPGQAWLDFVKAHPNTRFSFVALGLQACTKPLEELAMQAKGDYMLCT